MRSRPGKVRPKTPLARLQEAGLLLSAPAPGQRLVLQAVFANSRPVEAEIGPGKGAFLLARAAQRPEVNLLGIEWLPTYAWYAADRAFRAGLGNVRLLCADAALVFRQHLPPRCLSRVHIYFPDPWPKRRHHRRRLIQPAFLRDLRRALRLGGRMAVVTDHAEYFRYIEQVIESAPGLLSAPFQPILSGSGLNHVLPQTHGQTAVEPAAAALLVGSNYERKYTGSRRRLHALAAIRYR